MPGTINYAVNQFSSPFLSYLLKNSNKAFFLSPEGINLLESFSSFGEDKTTFECMERLKSYYPIQKGKIDTNVLIKIELYRTYSLLKYNPKEGAKVLDSLFKTLPKEFNGDHGWIKANALMLAQNGDTTRTLKLLSYVQSAEEKNKILLNICYQLQDGPGVEYTYFYLNELLRNYSKDAKIGMALYRVLGKIGGYEAERNQARQKYRNTPELMKPKGLQNWVLGTAENGNYYKAKNLIPENVSETKELILMNQILYADIIKKMKKNQENARQGNWNDARFFDLDLFPGRNNNDFQFSSLE
jgi:hypothetical protein